MAHEPRSLKLESNEESDTAIGKMCIDAFGEWW